MTSDCTTGEAPHRGQSGDSYQFQERELVAVPVLRRSFCGASLALLLAGFDAHAVEAAVHEAGGDHEENGGQRGGEGRALLGGQVHGQRYGQQAEQGGELDDGVESHGAGVLEGIANRIADHGGIMQRGAFGAKFGLDHLLGVVPGAAGIGHEEGLVQTEQGDGDQIADEEVRFEEGERKGGEEDHQEDVQHALLRILRADGHHLLGIGHGSLLGAFEPDVLLDELDGAVRVGGDGLGASAGEPIDHRAAGDDAQQERGVHQGELVQVDGELVGEQHDGGKDHGSGADHGGADEHWFGGGLEGVAGAVVLFQVFLGLFEIHSEAEVLLDVLPDIGQGLDHGEFVDGLGVVGDGAIAIDGDGDRSHAEEAEGHQAEGEDRWGEHDAADEHRAHVIADAHEGQHGEAQPVSAKVAGHKAGEDVERRTAFARAGDDLADVARVGGGEDLDELGDEGAGEGAATDDGGELPPHALVAAELGDHEHADDVGEDDGKDGGEPDEGGEGRFEVKLGGLAEAGFGDDAIDEIADAGRDHHHDAHAEDPDQELHLDGGTKHGQDDEGDEGDAGDAVGFEAIGGGADGIAGIVAGAIGDHAGVADIGFLDLEDDLHEGGAQVGNLGQDAAAHAQGGGAERFADGEADEAFAGEIGRNEEQDAEHDEQLNRNQEHADAHAGLQGNVVARIGLAAERGESGARVGEGVDAHAEGRHGEAAGDADHTEEQDDG